MTRKIFRSILLVAGVVLAAGMVIMTGCLYSYFGGVQEQQLQDELSLAVSGVENGGTDYLERLPAERFRLTWIASDGRVLYDTQVADVASMENHAGRQEVQEALKNGSGESSRYSDTLLQQTLYVARRLADGTVLRISVSRATAGMLALGMLQPMLVVLAAALIFAGLMAGRLSRRIVDPLNRLDLEHPLENDAYEELAPLLSRINYQHKEIDAQLQALDAAHHAALGLPDQQQRANKYAHEIVPIMEKLRAAVDEMEVVTDRDHWPVPTYNDMLFYV